MTIKKAIIYKIIINATLFDKKPSLITMVDRDEKNFNTDFLNRGASVKDKWPSDFTVFVSGIQPVDYLLCGLGYDGVSDSARKVIESTVKSGVEFLPVNLVEKKTNTFLGQYWILNIINNIDALDWEHTKWITPEIPYNAKDAYLDIIKPAFKLQAVEHEHMFLLRVRDYVKSGIYISASLMKNFKSKHATVGMDFMPIKVT